MSQRPHVPLKPSRRQRRAERDIAWQTQALRPHNENGAPAPIAPIDVTRTDWWARQVACEAAQAVSEPALADLPEATTSVTLVSDAMRANFAKALVALHCQGISITDGHTHKFLFDLGDDRYEVWIRESSD